MVPGRRAAPVLVAMAVACGGGDAPATEATRETLPNGATLVRHGALPLAGARRLTPDLEVGVLEGEAPYIFGDVRGIEVREDGTILVLDHQAVEIRAFDQEGRYLSTIASRGDGPGELREANGMVLKGDTVLWVQDHGWWTMLGLDPEGGEVARHPMHVRSYGYFWSGTVDDRGVFWKDTSHSEDEPTHPPPLGLVEGSVRSYLKSWDPRTDVTDSIFLGEATYRTWISQAGAGWRYRSIPFDRGDAIAFAPDGGAWVTDGREYRVTRVNAAGDTTLVLESAVEPDAVTRADRAAYVRAAVEMDPDGRAAAEQVAALMPASKPVIASLGVDGHGRLWVKRAGAEDEDPAYDVFADDGEWLGNVLLGFAASPVHPIVVRGDALYAVTLDEMGVARVVRAPLPPL